MLTKEQIKKLSAKEQLACGEITVICGHKGAFHEKQVIVPEWLFDLATHTDEHIFENTLAQGWDSRHIKKMSNAMFTGLLLDLRAKNRQ